eukprot:COSAG02_NODE_1062_length_14852_cov_93.088660_2_plen_3370_part_00
MAKQHKKKKKRPADTTQSVGANQPDDTESTPNTNEASESLRGSDSMAASHRNPRQRSQDNFNSTDSGPDEDLREPDIPIHRLPPSEAFVGMCAAASKEMHHAAGTIQTHVRNRLARNQRDEAARIIQSMWDSTQVELASTRRCGLFAFLVTACILLLASLGASWSIFSYRVHAKSCESNPQCSEPNCGASCEQKELTALTATNFIMLSMTLFLAGLCATAVYGALRKSLAILRFFSFALLVLIALEISLIMVFTDAESDVSMQFKKEALGVYVTEYCSYGPAFGFNITSDETFNHNTSNVTGADLNSVCACVGSFELATDSPEQHRAQCAVDWFDENLHRMIIWLLILIAGECFTSFFCWHILAKKQDFAEMVDGYITRGRKRQKDAEDDGMTPELLKSFQMPKEAMQALQEEEALITDTWYFESTVVFSVVLAMWVLINDSPAQPPDFDLALLLRVVEIFVTVFLSLEMSLELAAHLYARDKLSKYVLNFWTLLDIFVLTVSWFYLYSPNRFVGVCRVLRVLRPMRTIRIFESVQIVGRCIAADAVMLRDVMLLTMMLLCGFALVGLTCFHGSLQYTCVRDCPIPCRLGHTVMYADLFLQDQYGETGEGKPYMTKEQIAMRNHLKSEWPAEGLTCTAHIQENSSYYIGGVCGSYYQGGERTDIVYEKSTRQRFEEDIKSDAMWTQGSNRLVASCPNTLRCSQPPAGCPNGDADCFLGDDFVYAAYREGGELYARRQQIAKDDPTLPQYIQPQYGRNSWYGRTSSKHNIDTTGVACVKMYGDPYARTDLGTPEVLDVGTSPAGRQRYGTTGGSPRALTPDGDDTGLRGFDNFQQAVFTMIIHFSGDNGMHMVPSGLQDSDSVQGPYAWGLFAVSGIILCFVTLNLLLAVCCSAFSEVSRILKEKERQQSKDPFLKRKGAGDMGEILAKVMKTGGVDLDEPFHGTSALNKEIFEKEWPRKGCGRCRNVSHDVVIKHGGLFREVAVVMIMLYFFLLAWPMDSYECDITVDENCRYPLYSSLGIKVTMAEFRVGAESFLVLFFIVEFFLNIAAQGMKLYLRRQENVLDMIAIIATVVGTVGTYVKAVDAYMVLTNQMANQTDYCQESGDCQVFTWVLSDFVTPSVMRALRLGRIGQLFRMLYKHKPMFEVMVKVFKSWKAILGVTIFSFFTVSMFTIICMHLMGGGRGPPFAQCQDPIFCRESGRSPAFCLESYTNSRGHISNLIVSQHAADEDSCDRAAFGDEACNWLPMWYDTVTGSLTDVDTVDGSPADGEAGFNWRGSKIDWSVNPIDPKPSCEQFDPSIQDTQELYDEFIAASGMFASGTACVQIDTEEKCLQHGRCKIKGQINRKPNTEKYIRYNQAMCMANPTLYEWQPLDWVEAVELDDYPRQHFETFYIGMLTQLMVMLGDDWSEVMMDYMVNGAIGDWTWLFMSFSWLALHGILYSMFVAVLLINFSVDEDEKMPLQRAQWHHDNKQSGGGESALLKQLKIESGAEKEKAESLVSKLQNSWDPDKPHRSFYIFGLKNPIRILTAQIEQDPRTTKSFLILVTATLVALTYEGVLNAQYEDCLAALETVNTTDNAENWFGTSDEPDAEDPTISSIDSIPDLSAFCFDWSSSFRLLENLVVGIFFTELVIKSITNGFLFRAGPTLPYLRGTQNFLNFLALCLLSWTYTDSFLHNFGDNKVRLVRSLAPMVALLQNESINDVVASFFKSLPGVATIIMPMIFIGLMFVVVGVEYFGGRLRYCACPDGSSNYQNSMQLDEPYKLTQMYPPYIPGNATDCDNRPGPGEPVHGAVQCDGTFAAPIEDMQGEPESGEIGPQRGMKACLERGYAWINPPGFASFDDNADGAMMLFLLASSGYVEVMEMVMDITDDPNSISVSKESDGYAAYFVAFHLFFNFFLLNLFIGVMSSTFSVQTGKAIVTEGQKRYTQAVDICLRFDPVFTAEESMRPVLGESRFFDIRMYCFNIVSSRNFHWLSIGMVFANMVLLCTEHYPINPTYQSAAEVLNTLFLLWFTIEFLMKLIGFGWENYFDDNWLAFDAVIVTVSIALRVAGNGSGLEVFKVLRCCKLVFLAKSLSTLIDLMRIVAASLINAFDVVIISMVIFSIYATMGFRLFAICGHHRSELNVNSNFESFGSTFMILFQIMCGQQYTGLLAEINQCMVEQYGIVGLGESECAPPTCGDWNAGLRDGIPGLECEKHCGSLTSDECRSCIAQGMTPLWVFLYFGSFFFMSVFIIANLFIVSVLDSFDVQSRVDQEIDREDLWGFTFAWAELTIGAHACPALTRSEAHEFRSKLADIIVAQEAEEVRNEVSVKVSGVPPRALVKDKITKIFEPYGQIINVGIRAHDPKTDTGGYAIITFTDKDNVRLIDCLSEVKWVEGVPVEVAQFKLGGKFKNGVAHLRVPGHADENDNTTGTLSIQIRSLKGFLPEDEPYIKCTLCAKHKHHGGHDISYQTRALSLTTMTEVGDWTPRSPMTFGARSPARGGDSPSMSVGQKKWDHEQGSVFYGDTFRYHINEHTLQFAFQAMDMKEMTHTASIGIAHKPISALKDCREPTMMQLDLNRILDDGSVFTGAQLEVEVCFSTKTYVPKFDFLSEFNADNSRHKEADSSGIEGWIFKKSPDQLSHWERTWVYVALAPEPALRLFESTTSEHSMEHHGRTHQLLELRREFFPHQITGITNGFDSKSKLSKTRNKLPNCFDCKEANSTHHSHSHNLIQNCEFQFETVDELEDGRGEDNSEENDGGLLHVHLVEASGLPQMDARSLTDAYIHAHLISDSKRHKKGIHLLHHTARHTSEVCENTLDPQFDEAWIFKLHKDTTGVHIKVIDNDPIGRDDPIGQIDLSIEELVAKGAEEWDVWLDIQPIKHGPKVPDDSLGRVRFKFEWCSPLDATQKLVEWSARDQEAGRSKSKRRVWRFRAMCPEHKYAWIHALTWLSNGCTGPRPARIPAPPMHQDDVRIAANNVALIDLPFVRLRNLLYNLYRFDCFGCKSTPEYELYALFQLELHAYRAQVSRSSTHVVVPRTGISAQLGQTLSHIRGLNFHLCMQRLALLQYGKSNSLPYSQLMAEYEMEKNTVALHVIQTCLSYWAMCKMARKPDARLPQAAYWRRTNKDIELAKRETERLKASLSTEKLSVLRKKAVEYGVSEREMDRIDDTSNNPHADMLALVLEAKSFQDSKVNTGRTKTAFYIGALGARNMRLASLRRLKLQIKKHDPLVVYGDPEEDLKEKLYALQHPDEFIDDPMAPTEGPSCLDRRKLKRMQRSAEHFVDDVEHFADSVEAKVDSMANMVGDSVGSVTDAVEKSIGFHESSSDVETGDLSTGVRRGSVPMERELSTPSRQSKRSTSQSNQGSREIEFAEEFENPVAAVD